MKIDNKKVKVSREKGIERVKNVGKEMQKGQSAKMGEKEKANWKRPNSAMTPCKG